MANTEFSSTENGCKSGGGCSTRAAEKGSESLGGCGAPPAPAPASGPVPIPTIAPPTVPLELHVCMGLNACQGHDRFGTNDCAGKGYCATAQAHHCRTLNNCRGQGGCGLFGSPEDYATPGANDCASQGACAVPIQAERFDVEGANKGKSVWVLARRLFEDRMKKARRTVGPSPHKCGPPQAWLLLESNGTYDSCGDAGDKAGTFGFNDPAKDAKELCEKSFPHILCSTTPEKGDAIKCGSAQEGSEAGAGLQAKVDDE